MCCSMTKKDKWESQGKEKDMVELSECATVIILFFYKCWKKVNASQWLITIWVKIVLILLCTGVKYT